MNGAPRPTVLLLIDLQRAFCDVAGSMARQGRPIAAMQEAARNGARLAAAAHQAKVPVIWTRMQFRADYADGGRLISDIRPNLAQIGALRAGTSDAELADGVGYAAGDTVIEKARYSALYGTALEVSLRAMQIARIVVGGVTTSMCVESTVRDLGQRDYEVIVAREACGDFDESRHDASLAAMAFGFASVESVAECLRRLDARDVATGAEGAR
jgi:nicotinamidase-related amidase